MKQWLIYKHTSMRSHKSYIGLTCTGMENRWIQHLRNARNGSNLHFHRAIRLYGEDNWTHEIIADQIDTLEEANTLEQYYIKKFDTFENGYNLTEGGDGNSGLKKPEYFVTRTWYNLSEPTEECSAIELIDKYPYISIENMRDYFSSGRDSVKGWTSKCASLLKVRTNIEEVLILYHATEGTFKGTVSEFSKLIGKRVAHIGKMLNGRYKLISGWRKTKEPYKRDNEYVVNKIDVTTSEVVATYYLRSELSKSLDSKLRKSILKELDKSLQVTSGKFSYHLLRSGKDRSISNTDSNKNNDTNIGVKE